MALPAWCHTKFRNLTNHIRGRCWHCFYLALHFIHRITLPDCECLGCIGKRCAKLCGVQSRVETRADGQVSSDPSSITTGIAVRTRPDLVAQIRSVNVRFLPKLPKEAGDRRYVSFGAPSCLGSQMVGGTFIRPRLPPQSVRSGCHMLSGRLVEPSRERRSRGKQDTLRAHRTCEPDAARPPSGGRRR